MILFSWWVLGGPQFPILAPIELTLEFIAAAVYLLLQLRDLHMENW